MKLDVIFVHLHNPLFFARKNWGEKIDIRNTAKGKVSLVYDRDTEELEIKCEGSTAFIPKSNIVSYEPMPQEVEVQAIKLLEPVINPLVNKAKPGPKTKAQASSPTDHVFAGAGAGKTND